MSYMSGEVVYFVEAVGLDAVKIGRAVSWKNRPAGPCVSRRDE